MKDNIILKNEERAIFALRSLYEKHGYSRYKMGKFEEYDLYVDNKDFLISDSVITFTDTNGKLMALKPDVTLSIIKNTKDSDTRKVYYNENVYRTSGVTHAFKEIMQTGLEYIGDIDNYCISEVLGLAAESLTLISENCVLDVSHLGILSALTNGLSLSAEENSAFMKSVGEKNIHEIAGILNKSDASEELKAAICETVSLHGRPGDVFPKLKDIAKSFPIEEPLSQLETIVDAMDDRSRKIINIDFSVVNDITYYNGIVFKGFIEGIPQGVLSGGQYDKLMKKMRKSMGAIGFAVYLDMLERLEKNEREYDTDVLLLYGDDCDISDINRLSEEIIKSGKSVTVLKSVPEKLKFREVMRIGRNGVETIG